jgi:hypothetical protein
MALYKSKKSALILIIALTLPFLDVIVDVCIGVDESLQIQDLKVNNIQKIGYEDISASYFKCIVETTHLERAHVHPVQSDRAPPQA